MTERLLGELGKKLGFVFCPNSELHEISADYAAGPKLYSNYLYSKNLFPSFGNFQHRSLIGPVSAEMRHSLFVAI